MLNQVTLVGRITKNIELKYTESNIAVCGFTIAVSRSYKNMNGEYDTDFINCVAYRNFAENMNQYTKKGDLVAIRGRLHTRSYENKEGKKVFITEVVAEKISFLSSSSSKKEEKTEQQDMFSQREEEIEKTETVYADDIITDEDLPF